MRVSHDEWTDLMRSANAGDSTAYHRLLKSVTPVLRAKIHRRLAHPGQSLDQAEDIVQVTGGTPEAANMERERTVRAMAVCDRPQQANRRIAPAWTLGVRQYRRVR